MNAPLQVSRRWWWCTASGALAVLVCSSLSPCVSPVDVRHVLPEKSTLLLLLDPPQSPPRQYRRLLLFTAVQGACALHLFKEYVLETQPCAGSSMLPTLSMAGDMLVINKWHYMYGRNIRIGDVVVVKSPDDPGVRMAKTVIGMGGDLVCMDPSRNMREYLRVPPGHVWVTGNNLSNSWDSRQMGPIPLALVLGKATHKLSFVKLQWPEPIRNALHLVDE